MERAAFRCEYCGDEKKTLNVHHKFYEKCFKPWDYEDEILVCICDVCHQREHEAIEHLKRCSLGMNLDYWLALCELAVKLAQEDLAKSREQRRA